MSIDYQGLLFDKIYPRMGVDATIITNGSVRVAVTAIDRTEPAPFSGFGGIEFQAVKPLAFVRMSEILTNKINADEDLKDGQLVMNGKTWTIKSYEYAPTPKGIRDGEVRLILADDNG